MLIPSDSARHDVVIWRYIVNKTREDYPVGNTERHRLIFQRVFLRTSAYDEKYGVGTTPQYLGCCVKEVRMPLVILETC